MHISTIITGALTLLALALLLSPIYFKELKQTQRTRKLQRIERALEKVRWRQHVIVLSGRPYTRRDRRRLESYETEEKRLRKEYDVLYLIHLSNKS